MSCKWPPEKDKKNSDESSINVNKLELYSKKNTVLNIFNLNTMEITFESKIYKSNTLIKWFNNSNKVN